MKEIRKFWISDDRQGEIGSWSVDTTDEEIWAELLDQGHDGTGEIRIGDWIERT